MPEIKIIIFSYEGKYKVTVSYSSLCAAFGKKDSDFIKYLKKPDPVHDLIISRTELNPLLKNYCEQRKIKLNKAYKENLCSTNKYNRFISICSPNFISLMKKCKKEFFLDFDYPIFLGPDHLDLEFLWIAEEMVNHKSLYNNTAPTVVRRKKRTYRCILELSENETEIQNYELKTKENKEVKSITLEFSVKKRKLKDPKN